MKGWSKFFICLCLLFAFHLPVQAQHVAIPKQVVNIKRAANLKDLVSSSTLIAYGWFDTSFQKQPLNKSVQGGQLVNFVQNFHVDKYVKGTGGKIITVLSTGIEPLPDPLNPNNKVYPGPMAEGRYFCFLKPVPGTKLYTIVGGWQGVYPVYEGKTISLEEEGFPELNQLTLRQFEAKIKSY
ncbi:hypothetical protein [Parageobacillus thermoglucosidasius]|uniref:hypothetical protein n=1 Tax=Parageobacillus thermoglucosidasius TaxID=1426 RepID=UPI000B56D53D|nr:hypothetical protein [Parageobacillus thermoglucosidasius]MBY6270108.1 hypothetical protein [Parageobacillus thermoglucosidasius]OUM89585.1 MAG: hypothetical protein BAA00_07035 [Parageobacillus thermoglucosidasius]